MFKNGESEPLFFFAPFKRNPEEVTVFPADIL